MLWCCLLCTFLGLILTHWHDKSANLRGSKHMTHGQGNLNSAYLQGYNLVHKSSTILLTCQRGWVGEMENFLSVFEEHHVFVDILPRKDEGSYT